MDDLLELPSGPMEEGTDHGIKTLRFGAKEKARAAKSEEGRKRKAESKSRSSTGGSSGPARGSGAPSKKRARVDTATRVFRGKRSDTERSLEGLLFGAAKSKHRAESIATGPGPKEKRSMDNSSSNKSSKRSGKDAAKTPKSAHSATLKSFGQELEAFAADAKSSSEAASGAAGGQAEVPDMGAAFDTGFFQEVLGAEDGDDEAAAGGALAHIGGSGAGSAIGESEGGFDMDAVVSNAAAVGMDEFTEDVAPMEGTAAEGEDGAEVDDADDDDDDDDATTASTTLGGLPPPAWNDSDDDKLKIDVSAVRRARKLRVSSDESVLSGAEYSKRLRSHMTSLIRGPAATATEGWSSLPSLAAARAAAAREAKAATKALEAATKAKVAAAFGGAEDVEPVEDDDSSSDSEVETERSRGLHLLREQWIFGRGNSLASKDKGPQGRAAIAAILGSAGTALTMGSQKKAGVLKPGKMGVSKCSDVNAGAPVPAVVQRIQFHPSASVLASVGFDKRVRLYSVDGARSGRTMAPPPLATVFLADLPIRDSAWVGSAGRSLLVSGRRPWAYNVDVETGAVTRIVGLSKASGEKALEKVRVDGSGEFAAFFGGRTGSVVLAGNASHGWIGNLRMPRRVTDLAWAGNSSTLVASTTDGTMYEWDVRMTGRECVAQWSDVDGLKVTALGVAPGPGGFVATGGDSGVVNVYRNRGQVGQSPVHVKSAMSLTSTIDGIRWSGDGQVAAMWSRETKDALRLVHGDSGTVFHDWPLAVTRLRYVSDVAWSPGNGFLAVANDQGRIGLYRMHPYSSM